MLSDYEMIILRPSNRIKRSFNLTLLLASVEFLLLFAFLLIMEFSAAVFDDNTTNTIRPIYFLAYPFFIVFYKIIWAGYPSTMIFVYALNLWKADDRISIFQSTMSNITGCAVFFSGYFYFFDNGNFNLILDINAAEPRRMVRFFFAIIVSSVIAPILISLINAHVIEQWLNRLKRALSIVVLLVFVEVILLTIISVGLEITHIALYGIEQSSFSDNGQWWAIGLLVLSFAAVFYGIALQNYTIVTLLIIVQDFTAANNRKISFFRLLTASAGGYILLIGLIALEMGGLPYPLSFEFLPTWVLNFLYTIGITVILAPIVLFSLSFRIKWLDRLLRGYQ